jgi:hypothetical protein
MACCVKGAATVSTATFVIAKAGDTMQCKVLRNVMEDIELHIGRILVSVLFIASGQ